jgi:hypothetical protein
MKKVYISRNAISGIVPVLRCVDEGRMGVLLPNLWNKFLEEVQPLGGVSKGIEEFVAMGWLSGNPIAIYIRKKDWSRTGFRRPLSFPCCMGSMILCDLLTVSRFLCREARGEHAHMVGVNMNHGLIAVGK